MQTNIHSAAGSEASELTAIAFAAKRSWGYPEDWLQLWAAELTIDSEYIATHPVYLAVESGRTVGWIGMALDNKVMWVEHCWVVPQAQGRGIGKRLLATAFEVATSCKAETLKVISDPGAEPFYTGQGFTRVELRDSLPAGRRLPVLEAAIKAA